MADEGINVAILKGLIQMDYDPEKMAVFLDQLTSAKAKQISAKTEGDRLKQSFDRLSASLDPVVARQLKYNQAVATLDKSLKAGIITQQQYNTTLAQAKERLQDTTTWTQRLGSEIGGSLKSQLLGMINPTTLAVGAAVGGLALLKKTITDIIQVSIEAEESQRKVGFAVEQYGARAGVTVEQIDDLANAQSRLTGADDEEIASATALSLRFNRISGEDLPRLIAVAQDMAKVLGTDIPSATDKAAAYINLPAQALTKLKKEGYAVSDAQSKMVKDFLIANDVASAQGVIFDILEEQYGGAAAAARDTMGGALTALGTSWENFLEKVGEDRLGPLRQGVESLIDLIEIATGLVDDFGQGWINFDTTVRGVILNTVKGVYNLVVSMDRFGSLMPGFSARSNEAKKVFDGLIKSLEKPIAQNQLAQMESLVRKGLIPKALLDEYKRALGLVVDTHKAGTGSTKELTEAEEKLKDELKKQREEWEKLLAVAANAVISSQEELSNTQALLQARKISTDAMKLQQTIQQALNKAQAAGKAATSEQRLEIIRNTIAVFQAKNAIDAIADAQDRAADLFAESNKEMLRQINILSELQKIVIDFAQSTIDVNINQVSEGGQLATETTRARLDYAREWRETWESASDVANDEIQRVMGSLLTVEEKERAIAQIRSELLDHHLSEWGSFFGTLGSMFGGIFQQISSAIDNIQQAQKAGNQFGSLIGGQGSQLATTAGYFAATVAIFYEVYKAVDAQIQKNRRRKWGTETQLEITDGDWSTPSYFSERGEEINRVLRDVLEQVLDSLDAVVDDLPQISIRARKDGKEFSAYVAGVFVGVFGDAETAIQEGVRYALASGTFEAISVEMAQALKASLNGTMEELQQNIATANAARRARLGDAGFGFAELTDDWLRLIESMRKMGLAIDDAIAQKNRELEAYKNNVLGMDLSSVQRLRDIQSLSAGLAEAADVSRAAIRQQMEDIQRQIDAANRRAQGGGAGAGAGGRGQNDIFNTGGEQNPDGGAYSKLKIDDTTSELQRQLEALQKELDKIPEALSEVEIDMGIFNVLKEYLPETAEYAEMGVKFAQMEVEKKFQELKLTLIAMGEWEQWAAVWNDAYENAMNLAGKENKPRGGRGGTGGGRDEVRDFIKDRREDLRLNGLSEHARAIAELDRQYAPMLEKAGKDKKLREQLLNLKEAEIRQLERENIKTIVADFQEFVNVASDFDGVRQTATDLIDRIEESAMGDPRKANMISRVLGQMNAQIEKMSKEKALSLFDSMASDLISLGATEESLADARKAMQLLDHQLKMENYRTEIEILRAKGSLDAASMAIIDDAFSRLQRIDLSNLTPPVVPPPPGGPGYYDWITNPGVFQGYGNEVTTTIDDVGNALQEAQDLFQQYVDEGLSPFNRDLRDLNRDFAIIFEQMGQGPEVMNQYALAMERLNEQYSGDLEDLLNDLNFGANTDLSLEDQLSSVMSQFSQISSEIASGDLSNAGLYRSLGNQALQLLGRVGGSGSAEYDAFRERLRSEVNLVLGNGSGPGNLLPLGNAAATEQTTSLLGDINTQSGRQVNRLDTAIGLLGQLVTAVNRTPAQGGVRLSIGSEPTIPTIPGVNS